MAIECEFPGVVFLVDTSDCFFRTESSRKKELGRCSGNREFWLIFIIYMYNILVLDEEKAQD